MGGDCPTTDLAWFSMCGTDLSNDLALMAKLLKNFFKKIKIRSRKNTPKQ
jgi:hypothetical protein